MTTPPETPETPGPARPRTCASCRFWDVRIPRTRALEDSVAYCRLSQFSPFHLVVSGSSGCDAWTPSDND